MATKRALTGTMLSAVGGLLGGSLALLVARPFMGDDPASGLLFALLSWSVTGAALVPGALWATQFSRSRGAVGSQRLIVLAGAGLFTGLALTATRVSSEQGLTSDAMTIGFLFTLPSVLVALLVLRSRSHGSIREWRQP